MALVMCFVHLTVALVLALKAKNGSVQAVPIFSFDNSPKNLLRHNAATARWVSNGCVHRNAIFLTLNMIALHSIDTSPRDDVHRARIIVRDFGPVSVSTA